MTVISEAVDAPLTTFAQGSKLDFPGVQKHDLRRHACPNVTQEKAAKSGGVLDPNALFDLSPVASVVLSPSLQIVRPSRSLCRLWALQDTQLTGRDICAAIKDHALLSADDHARIAQLLHESVSQRAVRALAGPGAARHSAWAGPAWSVRVVPIFEADALLSIILDWAQTAAKAIPVLAAREGQSTGRSETLDRASTAPGRRLTQSPNLTSGLSIDESYRLLIDTVEDYAIFLLDTDGSIATWNAGAELNKGYSRAEVVGKHFSIFYGPEDIAARKPEHELEECRRCGRFEDEGWRVRKDGSRFWANVTMTAIYKDGVHVGFGKVTRNMTERRAAELRVIAAYEESAKLKSNFLANMSHEIRTPMHGMLSACSLLLNTPLSEDQRETVSIIDESGQVLLRVINDILDYSKLASGSFSMHADIVGVASIIASVVRSAQPTLQPSVRLHLALAGNLPRAVQGDPLRYRQIVQNLVSNAAKFTDRGKIRVASSVRSHDDDAYIVLTQVTDSGIGVPEDAIPSLFVPFTQVDDTTKKRFQGTGLGLSICKSLVELMGGEIGFHANPEGQGSVFWFTARFLKIKSLSQLNTSDAEIARERQRPWAKAAMPVPLPPPHQAAPAPAPAPAPEPPEIGGATAEAGHDVVGDMASPGSPVSGGPAPELAPGTAPSPAMSPETPPCTVPIPLSAATASKAAAVQVCAVDEPPKCLARPSGPLDLSFSSIQHQPLPLEMPPPSKANGNESFCSAVNIVDDRTEVCRQEFEDDLALLRLRAPTKRLLIAEDNAINQRVMVSILKIFGFRRENLAIAADGGQAVARAQEQPAAFDLCLMDVSMPVMDGHDATRKIRGLGIRMPIVAMTAFALRGDREQCLACGMDDYIAKPVQKQVLINKLLRWLPE